MDKKERRATAQYLRKLADAVEDGLFNQISVIWNEYFFLNLYQVQFATSGRYYIALLGWGPDSDSNSVHMGLGGTITGNSDNLGSFTTSSGDPPEWIRDSGWYIDIPSAGSYTLVMRLGNRPLKIMESVFVAPEPGVDRTAGPMQVAPTRPELGV